MSSPTVLNKPVGPIGYGLLGLTMRGPEKPFDTSIETMRRAVNLGATCWNGGEIYGTPERNSLHLIAAYFAKYPEDADKVVINIKGGASPGEMKTDGSEGNVRRSVDECLRILGGTKKLDIFEMARVDKDVGNETALRVLSEYVKEGKIGGIGLSEVNSKTIRAAVQQCPGMIAGVELELSLWTPDPLQNGILATCAELHLPVFAYSPLARGTISGNRVRKNADLPDGDFRKITPRFTDENLAVNNRIVDAVEEIAKRKGATIAQIAIGWVRGQSGRLRRVRCEDGREEVMRTGVIIPIPGASTVERVEENCGDIRLTEEELGELDGLIEQFPVQGDRYHAFGMKYVNS